MNIEQYPLLQYISKIDLYYNVCHSRLCEGTDEGPIFIRKVWDVPIWLLVLLEGFVHMTFERNDGI